MARQGTESGFLHTPGGWLGVRVESDDEVKGIPGCRLGSSGDLIGRSDHRGG